MIEISVSISQKIRNMGIVCALLVVLIHASFTNPGSMLSWTIDQIFKTGLSRVAVPYFFVVSGFFLARHFDDANWYGHELHKRIKSLFVPFCLWVLISICCVAPLSMIADVMAQRPFGSNLAFSDGRWIKTFGLDIHQGPGYVITLWYVRCLLLFVLIAPVFKWCVSWLGLFWLAFAFCMTTIHMSSAWSAWGFSQSVFDQGFSLSGAFYFSLGIYLCLRKIHYRVSKTVFRACVVISVLLILLKALLEYMGIRSCVDITTLAIPFMMLSLWVIIPSAKWPTWLTGAAFPLFLMHTIVIPYFNLPIKRSVLNCTTLGSAVVLIGTLSVCFLLTRILNTQFPSVASVLFAGRSGK